MLIKGIFNICLILSLVILGMSSSWLVIWILVETITVCIVVLMLSETITPRNVEAITKYYIMQAVASALLLFGILLHLRGSGSFDIYSQYSSLENIFILVAIFVKLAVFPNFWFVDLISGLAPTRAFYALVLSKIAPLFIFYFLVSEEQFVFCSIIGLFSVLSGGMMGINQTSIRKILAYSSIANLGWFIICFPILPATVSAGAFFVYILGVWPILFVCSAFSAHCLLKSSNLNSSGFSIMIFILSLLSLGGLPPLLGFFVKWAMFQGLLSSGYLWVCGVLILGSLLSLFFYLNIIYTLVSISWPQVKVIIGLGGFSFSWHVLLCCISILGLLFGSGFFLSIVWVQ
nr:NADH dehydrogenase subunit 2 [Histampica sp. CS049]